MARAKKKPAPKWRLYLVVAVDPNWGGTQYRGRFYKFGITTKANVLDRHPSYTEVLLSVSLYDKRSGTWAESFIRETLGILGVIRGDEFSREAVHCDAVTASVMKTLAQGYANILKYGKVFSHQSAFQETAMMRGKAADLTEEEIYAGVTLWLNEGWEAHRESVDMVQRTIFWKTKLVSAIAEWQALPAKAAQEPMWA